MALTDEEFKTKHANEVELAKRELERRSFDTIRVFNPLDHTFRYMRNRYWYSVPARTTKDIPRYLAIHFFKKICDFMIGQQIATKGDELKKLREHQMGHQYLDHYEENVEIWDRTPKINDPDLIQKIKEVVILGLVEEYGMEAPEPDLRVPDEPLDFRPVHEKIFGDVDKRIAIDKVSEPQFVPPAEDEIANIMANPESTNAKPKEELLPAKPEKKQKLAEAIL